MHKLNLHLLNNILSILVLVLGFYIIFTPLLPQFSFYWKKEMQKPSVYTPVIEKRETSPNVPIPEVNTLAIPKLNINLPVYEGSDAKTLRKGVWHRPGTSDPNKGGNTVMAAHRFTYAGPAIFYHLDKLVVGDRFILFWDKKMYVYEVNIIKVVGPNASEIEANTKEPIVTLYTCTPLWSAANRLVIQAKLVEEN